MKGLPFRLYAPGTCIIAAMLSGCAAPQPPMAAPGSMQETTLHTNVLVRSSGARNDISGWTAADLQSAYNLPSSTKGNGQIVAVVDAYDNPNVAADLNEYRSTFGLPKANFTKYNQLGDKGDYPQANSEWGVEIDLSVEMISASCPKCTIYLVEANSNNVSDLETAETEAVTLGAHIISNGFSGSGEDPSYFDTPGVEYLGAGSMAGDEPAAFDSVVAVGGTVLSKSSGKRGWSESVSTGPPGGCASGVRKPAWQHFSSYCKHRIENDVAAVASGVAMYDTYDYGGWLSVDGTSISTPFLAGVFGLAGNASKQLGGRTFWEKARQRYLYSPSGGSACPYSHGTYNTCSGWGTPNGIGAF
jgi:subtilase family serine protease